MVSSKKRTLIRISLGSSGLGSSPAWRWSLCYVFLGKTLHSHNAFLDPGVQWVVGGMEEEMPDRAEKQNTSSRYKDANEYISSMFCTRPFRLKNKMSNGTKIW